MVPTLKNAQVPNNEPPFDFRQDRPTHEEIATLAYKLWQRRGCTARTPDEDWLTAEQELINARWLFR